MFAITDRCRGGRASAGAYGAAAFWDRAEEPLWKNTSADVLCILDCCYASSAVHKGRNDDLRLYQVLAASSPDGDTYGPGPKSFTSALCTSLEELLVDTKEDEGFTVLKLFERISLKRDDGGAFLLDRLQQHRRSIELSRFRANPEREASFRQEEPEQASVVLRLSLKTSDLDNVQVEKLAQQMPTACREAGIAVRRMDWVYMEQSPRNPRQAFRNVVNAVIKQKISVRVEEQETSPTRSESTMREYPVHH